MRILFLGENAGFTSLWTASVRAGACDHSTPALISVVLSLENTHGRHKEESRREKRHAEKEVNLFAIVC